MGLRTRHYRPIPRPRDRALATSRRAPDLLLRHHPDTARGGRTGDGVSGERARHSHGGIAPRAFEGGSRRPLTGGTLAGRPAPAGRARQERNRPYEKVDRGRLPESITDR